MILIYVEQTSYTLSELYSISYSILFSYNLIRNIQVYFLFVNYLLIIVNCKLLVTTYYSSIYHLISYAI